MKFIFIGDIHGNLIHCLKVCNKNPDATIVAIGDIGVGFVPTEIFSKMPNNFRFFVGNHDNRQLARTLDANLGDFGEYNSKFFFVSGADSIDKERRIEGVNWWNDEELSYDQGNACLDMWKESKCQILVCHDCPQSIAQYNHLIYDQSKTRQLLQCMIEARKPKMVIYGHHHRSNLFEYDGIKVKQLGIDECFEMTL